MTGDETMSPAWSVERLEVGGRTRLVVRGELDAYTATEVHAAIEDSAAGDLELDLAGVTFIDSSGLAAVIEGHLRLGRQARRLVLIDRSPIVQRLLDLSGVARHLDLEPHPDPTVGA